MISLSNWTQLFKRPGPLLCRRMADLMGQRHKPEVPVSGRSRRPAVDPLLLFVLRQQVSVVLRLLLLVAASQPFGYRSITAVQVSTLATVQRHVSGELRTVTIKCWPMVAGCPLSRRANRSLRPVAVVRALVANVCRTAVAAARSSNAS